MSRLFTVVLLSIALVLVTSSFAALPRLGTDVIPTAQSINLTLDPTQTDYSGSVHIDLDVKHETSVFRLHAEQLSIDSMRLQQKNSALPTEFQSIESVQLEITSSKPLQQGTAELFIYFHNDFNTQAVSLYRMEAEGEASLYTQMEADEAREAFPCFDEPIFKIPYTITLTVPSRYTAVSNMPVENELVIGEMIKHKYKTSPPMPSYLIAIAIGDFDLVDIPDMPIPTRIVTPAGKGTLTSFAQESTPKLLAALEEYFGSSYPYEKLDLIAVPEFWPGAMENPGAITYAEGILVFDLNSATLGQKRRLVTVTAHELAHMWFGDLVTMEWWDDLWLNEAFATWMGNKISHQVYPEYGVDISRVSTAHGAMVGDARPSSVAIRQPVIETAELLNNLGAVYYKGEAVLGMFEQYIGEEKFRQGINEYLQANAWRNAVANDLWHALEQSSGVGVSPAMATFIEQPGVPLVMVSQKEDGTVVLRQKRFANYDVMLKSEQPWQIPVNIKYGTGSSEKTASVLFTSEEQELELPADGRITWVLPNLNAGGYYRWAAPEDMMLALAKNAPTYLTPQERVNFINNLTALLDAGIVDGGGYLDLLGYFGTDEHPQVLSALLRAIDKVKNAFIMEEYKPQFAVYVNHYFKPALDRIGMNPKENEDETISLIRPSLISYLAYEGNNAEVKAFVKKKFNQYMQDLSSIDPAIAGTVVGLACVDGDKALYDECKQRFENAQLPRERGRFLAALGTFEDEAIQKEALQYTLEGPLRPQEIWRIPGQIASVSTDRADYIFNWMTDNIDLIKSKIPPVYHIYLPYLAGGCSRERLQAAQEFFSAPENHIEGVETQLKKINDQVMDCVSLREREQKNVEKYITRFAETQD